MEPTDKNARFWAWYNARFQAGWWRSRSMWASIAALCAPLIIYMLDGLLAQWGAVAEWLKLSPLASMAVQAVIAVTVIPWLRARIQPPMQVAALRQAIQQGRVVSEAGTEAVTVAVPGAAPVVVVPPADPPPDFVDTQPHERPLP